MNVQYQLQHLDIKPQNLFLVHNHVKVADFGLVKHLERASASGILGAVTPIYAPPETFTGKISGRSDQYSLAIVYQELLTGQRPFNGKNARMLAQQHLNEEPELRSLPEAERPIIARALEKPIRTIAENSGVDGAVALVAAPFDRCRHRRDGSRRGTYEPAMP
jgi:serine/threonine protein kinase